MHFSRCAVGVDGEARKHQDRRSVCTRVKIPKHGVRCDATMRLEDFGGEGGNSDRQRGGFERLCDLLGLFGGDR